ncbi:MAG: hypothetical protein GXX96_39870 [Planctomycetaceae bacterium]|nr:hypothetical protein [Planctomycetaceae bacterium]
MNDVSGLTLEDFDEPFTQGTAVTFDGFTASRTLADGLACTTSSTYAVSGGALVLATDALGYGALTFEFAPSISAFGVTVRDAGTSGNESYSLTVSSVTTEGELRQAIVTVHDVPSALDAGNVLFFGFVTTAGEFSSVVFSSASVGDNMGWDNLYFGTLAASVPEPTTLSIWSAVGGMGLMAARREGKRKRIRRAGGA